METKRSPYILSSVDNALKVMDILGVKDNLSLAELTRISKLDKSSLFKILYTLEHREYVFKTADAKYKLGTKFTTFGDVVEERRSLADVAMPYMRKLRDQCHETVYLGVLNMSGRVLIMHMEEGGSSGSAVTRVGFEMESHCNAMGKVLLAWLEPAMQKSIIDSLRSKVYTDRTISSADELYPVLNTVFDQGWGEDVGERYPGNSALAVPVFDATAKCVATLSIVGPEETLKERHAEYLSGLLLTAETISRKLGA